MSLTQLDATHMMCEMATSAAENEPQSAISHPLSSEVRNTHMMGYTGDTTSLRINKSFNYAVSYVTAFLWNVVPMTDFLMWRCVAGFIPDQPQPTTSCPPPDTSTLGSGNDTSRFEQPEYSAQRDSHQRTPTAVAKQFGEDQEFILRLGGRKPAWFPVKQLEADYGGRLHVNAIVQHLAALNVLGDSCDTTTEEAVKREKNLRVGSEDGEDETLALLLADHNRSFLEVINGTQIAQLLLAGGATTQESISTAGSRNKEKEQPLPAQSRKRCRNSSTHTGSNHPVASLNSTLEAVLQCTRRRHLREAAIHLKKTLQIQAERAPQDDSVGSRADQVAKLKMFETIPHNKIQLMQYLAHHGKANVDAFAGCWDVVVGPMCRLHPAVKQSLRTLFTMFNVLTYNFGVGSALTTFQGTQPPMPPSTLLVLHAMRFVRLPMYDRMPLFLDVNSFEMGSQSTGCVSQAPLLFLTNAHYNEYLKACATHEDLYNSTTNPYAQRKDLDFTRRSETVVADALQRLKVDEMDARKGRQHVSSEGNRPSVHSLLREKGMVYQHLLAFLPKYRWMACVEYLIPMLISNKQWEDANKWLRYLLNEPVHTLSVPGTPTAFEFCYRYQKRGEWWHRLAMNLVQQKLHNDAYSILEEQLQPLPEESELLAPADQRRVRLLRALWPKEIAEMNLRKDLLQRRFCRRSDRLALEQLLIRLHQPPRRWAPLSLPLLSSILHKPRIISLHAVRDTEDSTRWSDVRRRLAPRRVEDFVLQWFKDGRGRKESSWDGLHCEGKWISLLAKIILRDAYYDLESPEYPPTTFDGGLSTDVRSISVKGDSVWLSPFQEAPLDLITADGFVSRRYSKIVSTLAYIESCSREEFIAYIRTRFTWKRTDSEEMEENAPTLHDSASDAHRALDLVQSKPMVNPRALAEENNVELSGSDPDDAEESLFADEKEVSSHSGVSFGSGNRIEPHAGVVMQAGDEGTRDVDISNETLVDVGDFPILTIAECVPVKPMCELIRRLYLSPMRDGYTIKFSGFPDLLLWNTARSEPQFKLIEVKSPNDTLSTKQNAVLDTLISCGFDTGIAHIIESRSIASPRLSSSTAQEHSGECSLPTRTTEHRLSGQIRVPGECGRTRRLSSCLQGSSAYNPVTL